MVGNNSLNQLDNLGLEWTHISKNRCEVAEMNAWVELEYSDLGDTLNDLGKKGCKITWSCECSPSNHNGARGAYNPIDINDTTKGGHIIVYFEEIFWESTVKDVFRHEIQHYIDKCKSKLPGNEEDACATVICHEMRAFKAQNYCSDWNSCWQMAKGYIGIYKTCKNFNDSAGMQIIEGRSKKCDLENMIGDIWLP
jgi:hypothetical protein